MGHFHRLVSDLDPLLLHDTLPGFHIAPDYLSHYHQVLTQAPRQLAPESLYCAEFIAKFQHLTDDLETAKQQGLLSLRVIHGDPKLNNFLFDQDSKKIVSIIDLDTVKPGLVHYDIGDCLRSCCHRLESNEFDLDICTAILSSYLSEAGAFFSDYDYHYLYAAIQLIPFELGLRFYTDYLEGNRYFKVTEPEQNLQRAADQFQLCESIMAQESAIKSLIEQLKSGFSRTAIHLGRTGTGYYLSVSHLCSVVFCCCLQAANHGPGWYCAGLKLRRYPAGFYRTCDDRIIRSLVGFRLGAEQRHHFFLVCYGQRRYDAAHRLGAVYRLHDDRCQCGNLSAFCFPACCCAYTIVLAPIHRMGTCL